MSPRRAGAVLLAVLTATIAHPTVARSVPLEWIEELRAGFTYRINVQSSLTAADFSESPLNPAGLLGLPDRSLGVDARPDLFMDWKRLQLGFKPRASWRHQRFTGDARDWNSDTSTFVTEWWAKLEAAQSLFISYGRENLQWGPSYSLSPSQPFNRNNGQNNPEQEVGGLEYARALWIPSRRWSVSAIANTGEGRLPTTNPFTPGYAVKLDFLANRTAASLIASTLEGGARESLGAYAVWYASDALILHTEGTYRWDDEVFEGLLGGVYTFSSRVFVVLEFFRDGDGCQTEPIESCFNPFLGRSDPAEVLFRKNYVFAQATHPTPWTGGSVTLRWIAGLDDASHRGIGIVEHELGDRWIAFAVGAVDSGEIRDEFGSVIEAAAMVGLTLIL